MHYVDERSVTAVQTKSQVRVSEARLGRVQSGDTIGQPFTLASLEFVGRVAANVSSQTVAYEVKSAPLAWRHFVRVFVVIDQLTHKTKI